MYDTYAIIRLGILILHLKIDTTMNSNRQTIRQT